MSWDIVLFSYKEKITSVETIEEDKLMPVEFDTVLRNHFNGITQKENHININGNGYSIEFFLDDEPVSNKMLCLHNEKALFELIVLARKEGWQIFDTGLDKMIDLDQPSNNGYNNFMDYLNYIINSNS